MPRIKSISMKFLILLACQSGCFIAGTIARADETANLRESQSPAAVFEPSVITSAKEATMAPTAKSDASGTTITKDAAEDGLIKKTEPLPQFYFPY